MDIVWSGTFHAIGSRLLRSHGRVIGVQPDFTVLDQSDAGDMLNLIRSELHHDSRKQRFARKETLAAIYSRTVNAGTGLKEIIETHFPWCVDNTPAIGEIFRQYTQRKCDSHLLDHDDLLLYWNALAASPAGARIAQQFDEVLVDEYQDTNALQAQLIAHIHQQVKTSPS